MNNYCIHLKKRKNKPFCKLLGREIALSECNSINAENKCKEYKTRNKENSFYKSKNNQMKNPMYSLQNSAKPLQTLCKYPQSSAEQCSNVQTNSNSSQIKKNAQSLTKKPVKKVKMHNKSKKLTKLERNRTSVFTDDLEHCYLCGKPREHLHEIIYGKNRVNSIKYNFVLPLCANHHTGKDGIHFNKELDLYYKRLCQIYFENNIGNRTEFIKIFGRSYL